MPPNVVAMSLLDGSLDSLVSDFRRGNETKPWLYVRLLAKRLPGTLFAGRL
jgi:hypothetical protein